ncbi:MAG: hypothetical protein AABY15_06505 [Nanoarchaeota archaeon]
MGQIIKQPNGKYCIFSSVEDNIIFCNMTPDEIIGVRTAEAKAKIEEEVARVIEGLESGDKPYHQFTMSYDEMLETIEEIHGKGESKKIKKAIES